MVKCPPLVHWERPVVYWDGLYKISLFCAWWWIGKDLHRTPPVYMGSKVCCLLCRIWHYTWVEGPSLAEWVLVNGRDIPCSHSPFIVIRSQVAQSILWFIEIRQWRGLLIRFLPPPFHRLLITPNFSSIPRVTFLTFHIDVSVCRPPRNALKGFVSLCDLRML